jgi:hypothetical protein
MRYSFFLLLLALVAVACQSGQKGKGSQAEALTESVMAAHDEVMPMMGEMHQMSKQLKSKAKAAAEAGDEMAAEKAREAAQALDQASEGMMGWMRQYEPVTPEMAEAEAVAYLEDQQAKVDKVKADILSSIEQAKSILNETPAP